MYNDAPESYTLGIEAKTMWQGHGLGNLAKVGRWTLGGDAIEKPTRDFSVQVGPGRRSGTRSASKRPTTGWSRSSSHSQGSVPA
jgi:hypothetical protein